MILKSCLLKRMVGVSDCRLDVCERVGGGGGGAFIYVLDATGWGWGWGWGLKIGKNAYAINGRAHILIKFKVTGT